MRPTFILSLAVAVLAAAGCSDRSTVAPLAPTPLAKITSETSTELWRSITTGETGPGSLYAISVPRSWSGDVVFYGHGMRDALEPVTLRDEDVFYAVRDQLGALGYAIAYSSFSENGYAVEDAARRMHQLRGLFASRFGQPEHSYLVGHSLGALAVMEVAERFAGQYDGVVPICGIVGGTLAQLDYAVNVRALFDYFYPGILPGTVVAPVPGYVLQLDLATQQRIAAALAADPVGLAIIASTAQTPLEFKSTRDELVQSLVTALSYHARGADNVLTFTHGKFPVSNVGVTYSPRPGVVVPPLNPVFLGHELLLMNAAIGRFDADRAGAVWAAKNFTPSGELKLPTITVHNRWDPLVPYFHEQIFGARVASAGAMGLLVQRSDPAWGYGHCTMPAAAQVQAITDLATWVATGVKPAS
jgi:pimeloyl-ACP methyl ester carboxylesterase